jgi:beta-glucanase (GH16 family)
LASGQATVRSPGAFRSRRVWASLVGAFALVLIVTLGVIVTRDHAAEQRPAATVSPISPTSSATDTGPSGSASTPGSTPTSESPTSPASPAGPWGPGGSWQQTFADEFDSSSLDRSKWRANRYGGDTIDKPFNEKDEAAAFNPRNVTLQDGQLVFTLAAQPNTVNGRRYPLTSGTVSTEGTFDLQEGDCVEARVYVPEGDGLWPAFWAMSEDSWPPEIDGFEFFDTAKQSRPRFNYHFRDGTQSGPEAYGRTDVDYRRDWHTYGWLRNNGRVIPYLDGVAYPEVAARGVGSRPYFIILNLSVMKGHQPQVGPGTSEMKVDWVRAWRPARSNE